MGTVVNPKSTIRNPQSGIALLIVVSLLTVIGIMGVAFAFSMYLETQETRQFFSTTQARYLAEAGVAHARVLLDEDRLGSRVDSTAETWTADAAGSEADVDGDGTRDARWWPIADAGSRTIGRYAVQITDEASKANLNAALADPPPLALGAINLTTLLEQAGLGHAGETALAIESYRYGADQRPGQAGIDDDADGAIDEADEYQPLAPRGDDRRLDNVEEVAMIAGLKPEDVRRLSRLATVYSWDANVSVTGKARVNVNTATANELLAVLLDAGVQDPWQAAVNMADYVDPDVELSRVTKSSQTLWVPKEDHLGGWTWRDEPEGHYASDEPNGEALTWSLSVPTGTFRLLARGLPGMKVGDVTLAGQLKASVNDGESLGVFNLTQTVEVGVVNREAAGIPCAFRGIELVSEGAESGVPVRGIEAVRINELMVDPKITLEVSTATFDLQGSDWGCPVGTGMCSNSGVGQSRWSWTSPVLHPGRYYVRVLGSAPGQTVGLVRIEGDSQLLTHGQTHRVPVTVGSDGKIILTIGKTASDGTYYLKAIEVSLQPDGEYVELINLTDHMINVSGWTIEGELAGGRQARLPSGSTIKPHGLLVAAVDLEDRQQGLAGNGIDARSAWEMSEEVNAVQLEFPNGAPSPDDDWLKVVVPGGGAPRLSLRRGSATVDEVEYPLPLRTTAGFQSLEKGDPSVIVDQDQDGIDEGWYPSLRLYTPGMTNDNEGLKEVVGLETVVHDPSKEISVLNRPLGGVGELAGLASGITWKPFASKDLAKIVDRLTVEGLRLEAEGFLSAGQEAWAEKSEGYYVHTDPQQSDVVGQWQWIRIPEGSYRLSLYGWAGEQMAVRWERSDGTFADWSPALSADAQGQVVIGQITIGSDGTLPNTLHVEVQCASQSGICHLDAVQLDPQLIRIGPVNVNTAALGVLLALPGMTDALASRIMAGRPYGDQEEKGRGIGDLLLGDVLGADEETKLATFRRLAHLLTVRSDVFQIVSVGQGTEGDRVRATQRIQTVVQR